MFAEHTRYTCKIIAFEKYNDVSNSAVEVSAGVFNAPVRLEPERRREHVNIPLLIYGADEDGFRVT